MTPSPQAKAAPPRAERSVGAEGGMSGRALPPHPSAGAEHSAEGVA